MVDRLLQLVDRS